MKTPLLALAAALLLAIPSARAHSRVDDSAVPPPEPPAMAYDTAARIHAMPRSKGRVLDLFPCCARMITADGVKFWIGSPGATSEVVRFVQTLREGHECEFPGAFLDWQRESEQSAAVIAVLIEFLPLRGLPDTRLAQCGDAQKPHEQASPFFYNSRTAR